MPEDNDVFEIMRTTRAMRRLKPDPIPDELVDRILAAGLCATNGGNSQSWRFLVVKDRTIKQRIQLYYRRAFDEFTRAHYFEATEAPPGMTVESQLRNGAAVEYLTDHFHEAPVWIVPCRGGGRTDRVSGASIYPAVQNMLLAARALGLGATLTARHLRYEAEVEAILGLPSDVHSYAIIPMGYPLGRFGPVSRGPLRDVVFRDRWGEPYQPMTPAIGG
jgi:nitroreductase